MTSHVDRLAARRPDAPVDRRSPFSVPVQWRRPRLDAAPLDAATLLARQRRAFGGVKLGAAFFGWVTAVSMAVLLTLGVLALMIGVSIAMNADPGTATDDAAAHTVAVSILGAILLAVVVFGAFLCGGYVAARMSRFDGVRQGVAVVGWTVAVPVGLLLAALGLDLGSRDVALSLLPDRATGAVLFGVLGVAALGAVLGGLLGERYHRRVDSVGLTGEQ